MNEALMDYLELGCVPDENKFLPKEARVMEGVSFKDALIPSVGAVLSYGLGVGIFRYMLGTPLGETFPSLLGASSMFIGLILASSSAIKWKGYTETQGKDTVSPSYLAQLYKSLGVYSTPLLLKMAQHPTYKPETIGDIKNYLATERQVDIGDTIVMEQPKTLFELVTEPSSPLKAIL